MSGRRKIGARHYRQFDDDSLQRAVEAVRSGRLTVRKAAEQYNIPKSTINRKVRGKHMNPVGHPTVLSREDEEMLVQNIVIAGNWGFPFSRKDIQYVVKSYLDRRGIQPKQFSNNLPGQCWCRNFLKRNRQLLSERLAENIKRCRAAVNHETMKKYFAELKISLEGVPPERILNFDETNITDDPGKSKVVVRKGTKYPEKIMDSSKASVSVMFTGSASGVLLPPYVVYKAEHLYDSWKEGGPKYCRYNRSKSGWFDSVIFKDYFQTVVVPYFQRLGPGTNVVICDNLASHKAVDIVEMCEQYNIRFVLLPANSTHLCQPLDVAYFRPLKRVWKNTLEKWKSQHRGCISKDAFPGLLKQTINHIGDKSAQNLIAGFCKTGIYPLDPEKVLSRLPKPIQNDPEAGELWNQTFQEYLSQKRTDSCNTTKQAKKRLNCGTWKKRVRRRFYAEFIVVI